MSSRQSFIERLDQELAVSIARFEENMQTIDFQSNGAVYDKLHLMEQENKTLQKKLLLLSTENHRLRQRLENAKNVGVESTLSEHQPTYTELREKYKKALLYIDRLKSVGGRRESSPAIV